jgi:cholestenol Delta-isomerase
VYNHDRMPGRMDFLGQMWKEYGLSDSRYIFCDPLLLCMEILSVVRLLLNIAARTYVIVIVSVVPPVLILLPYAQFGLGPLCFLTAWLITSDSGYRHSLQALVSTGHLYSNLLYFATSLYDDYILSKQYYRPEPFYFWAYFVGMNAIWLVIPASK